MWLIFVAAMASETATPGPAPTIEARTAIEARFQRIDRDGNGYITANEAPRLAQSRCQCASAPAVSPASSGWIGDFDSDGDARVSAAEFVARALAADSPTTLSRR